MDTAKSEAPTSTSSLSITEANQLILGRIAIADDAMILGFLPLEPAEEDAVLAAVRLELEQDWVCVEGLLRKAPAATAYALAAVPSRSLVNGGRFWPVLETELGLTVTGERRGDLAFHFRKVCRRLGLVDGTLGETGWVHAAPFVFQAGILHYWKDALATGLRTTLKYRPAPDIEDPFALKEFVCDLEERIHNQSTLKYLLRTEVGLLLVRRLVAAYVRNEWSALPAHLREPIRIAFSQVGRGTVLRSPFLAYDFAFREIQLVLPAVASHIASAQSHWRIGERRHAARKETRIPVRDLPSRQSTIELCELEGGYEAQTFSVDARLDENAPFRLFRADSGRERKLSLAPQIRIPAGSYVVVMGGDVVTNDEPYVESLSDCRTLEIELRPGDDALLLTRGEHSWRLSPALTRGFYVDRSRAETALLEDGELLHFGDNLGLIAFFPANEESESTWRLDLQCPDLDLQFSAEMKVPTAAREGVYTFESDLQSALAPLLERLSPGIHRLILTLSDSTGRMRRVCWYWKGLKQISNALGFDCHEWPENLNIARCRGLVRRENVLRFEQNYHAPFVTLALSVPDVTLHFPRAGVRAVIMDPGAEWEDELSPARTIVVAPDDPRAVHFHSGGFQTWKITAGGRVIAILDKKRTHRTVSLAGLADEAGGAGSVCATNENGDTISLFIFTKPLAASQPKVYLDHSENTEVWKFMVTIKPESAIGVRITDLSELPDPEPPTIETVAEWKEDGLTCDEIRFGASTIIVNAYADEVRSEATELCTIRLKLTHYIEALTNGLWSIEFYYRTDNETAWNELECKEKNDYSTVRFFAWGDLPVNANANWWPRLRRAGRLDGEGAKDPILIANLEAMSARDLERALSSCRIFSGSKYPSNVWKANAFRTQDFPVHLGKHQFNVFSESARVWWQQASLDLAEHAEAVSAPAVRQLLFASQPATLRLPREQTGIPPRGSGSLITESLTVPAEIHAAKSFREWILSAVDSGKVNPEVLFCYRNFMAISTGQEAEFSDFSLMNFLCGEQGGIVGVTDATQKLAEESRRTQTATLLDGAHLLLCIRALNRRCRAFEEAVQDDRIQPMAKAAQAVEHVSQQLETLAPAVARMIGWQPPGGNFWWIPPLLENPWAEKVASVTWVLGALARVTAHGAISPAEYDSRLVQLLAPVQTEERKRTVQNRLCIFLSLAPELFAFYTALFELRFPKSNNQ